MDQRATHLAEFARVNRALRLARVPLPAAKVARALHRHGVLGRNVIIVGANAIFAYEAAAGVFVDTSMLATGDVDMLFDARAKLRLRGDEAPPALLEMLKEADALGGEDDLQASHVPNMRWIANAPKFEGVAIGADGLPVPLACPDPRAFALYKLWMGTQDPTRDPVKRRRDMQQAHTVAEIVNAYLPVLPFEPEHLACFPKTAADLGAAAEFFRVREGTG